jgi:NitT/TauT family transport system substrate-binding protein
LHIARRIRRSLLLACTLAALGGAADAQDATTVRVGVLNILTDAPFIVADRKGYFHDEGLNVTFLPFHSASDMVVPMGAGQLDVGAGAATAGIFNSYVHGLNLRIVADKASNPVGYGFDKLLVRTELVNSGRFKTPADLKGLTIGENATVLSPALNMLLKKYHLNAADITRVNLNYSEQIAALQNGKVDATITTEPQATMAQQTGAAKNVMGGDQWYPNQEIAVVMYSGDFMKNRRDTAQAFTRAYLRGARYYYGALNDGHLTGPNAPDVIAILTAATGMKDPALYRAITPSFVNPAGKISLESIRNDLQFFRDSGLIEGSVRAEDIVDESFINAAAKNPGAHR